MIHPAQFSGKHRDRALIGVDRYMGKPHQETIATGNDSELLTSSAERLACLAL